MNKNVHQVSCMDHDSPKSTVQFNMDFLKNLDFSDIEQQMLTLKANLFEGSDASHQLKLDLIKEAIATDQYVINTQSIAKKLLEYSKETSAAACV